jgi:hypothetical protein
MAEESAPLEVSSRTQEDTTTWKMITSSVIIKMLQLIM